MIHVDDGFFNIGHVVFKKISSNLVSRSIDVQKPIGHGLVRVLKVKSPLVSRNLFHSYNKIRSSLPGEFIDLLIFMVRAG
jgi:hypothetical protein